MGLIDLKSRLHDVPGVEGLTMQIIAGRPTFGINGKVVSVGPNANEDDAANAIRAAMGSPAIAQIPAGVPIQPSADKIPPVAFPAKPKATSMSVTGASHASLTLKQLMEQQKAKISQMLADNMAKVEAGFAKQNQAAEAIGKLGDKVSAEGDDLLATVGQFSNELGVTEHG